MLKKQLFFSLLSLFMTGSVLAQDNHLNIKSDWKTDTSNVNSSVGSLKEFKALLPRDVIPPIDHPKFWTKKQALDSFFLHEPVISIEIDGEAKAYPLSILMYHEIVNDKVGNTSVTASYCPLCNAGIVFDRTLNFKDTTYLLDFGVSGMLRNSDMVMWDRQTETWWQQFTGDGLVGNLQGAVLTQIPSMIISVDEFFKSSPNGLILSTETGNEMSYGENPYTEYDSFDNKKPRLFEGEVDPRLPATERVISIYGTKDKIYPLTTIQKMEIVNDVHEGENIVIFYQKGMVSVLDQKDISKSKDIGNVGVFSPIIDGEVLVFEKINQQFQDTKTKSIWSITGKCTEGTYKGKQLEKLIHGNHFAFAWFEFNPDCIMFQPEE